MKANIYTQEGKEKGHIELPESIFGLSWNGDLVHQVVMSMFANARIPLASAKGRSEVSGGGRKPWRQKGTGRARHGSRRSPIWRGGGVTFGPGGESFARKINRKMRKKALFVLLSQKAKEGNILFIDTLSMSAPKTADAKDILLKWSSLPNFSEVATKKRNTLCLYLPEKDIHIVKSFANFGNISVREYASMNPVDVSRYKYIALIDPASAVAFLKSKEEVHPKKEEAKVENKK